MFCTKCGAEVSEGTHLCEKCKNTLQEENSVEKQQEGTEIKEQQEIQQIEEKKNDVLVRPIHDSKEDPEIVEELKQARRRQKTSMMIGWIVLCCIILVVGGIYTIKTVRVAQMERLARKITSIESTYGKYAPNADEQELFESKMDEFHDLELTYGNYNKLKKLYEEIKRCEKDTKERALTENKEKLEEFKNELPDFATKNEITQHKEYIKEIEKEIEKRNFVHLKELQEDWLDFLEEASEKKTGYDVNVVQADFGAFPNIKLYLEVLDEDGSMVDYLTEDMFYISDSENGNEPRRMKIKKVTQLDQKENLNLNLVVDISGSMGEYINDYDDYDDRTYFDVAKNYINSFLEEVQFQVGDRIRITPFNNYMYDRQPFSNDKGEISEMLNSFEPEGGTRLYDTLVYSIKNTATQEGAKCVIAFTDGYDTGGDYSYEDVIETAERYQVPVYIIIVGENGNDELSAICNDSGGALYEREIQNDISDLYRLIYQEVKNYYVLEYELPEDENIFEPRTYSLYVRDDNYGGEFEGKYEARYDVFRRLIRNIGDALAVDMTDGQYGALANYCESGSKIADQLSEYVETYKERNGSLKMTLVDIQITNTKQIGDNAFQVTTDEVYWITDQEKIYGDLENQFRDREIKERYDSVFYDDDPVLVDKYVYEYNKNYFIKRSSDGRWVAYEQIDATKNTYDIHKIISNW